ncbi:hypothetical protein AURDEDRAFT_119175 [Auricularia subglabra TFB-10046 SS5]|nr:hypothetical protein AURDEDRAFT_119175 [Auricularia subglabra TFB-10046 SS5]
MDGEDSSRGPQKPGLQPCRLPSSHPRLFSPGEGSSAASDTSSFATASDSDTSAFSITSEETTASIDAPGPPPNSNAATPAPSSTADAPAPTPAAVASVPAPVAVVPAGPPSVAVAPSQPPVATAPAPAPTVVAPNQPPVSLSPGPLQVPVTPVPPPAAAALAPPPVVSLPVPPPVAIVPAPPPLAPAEAEPQKVKPATPNPRSLSGWGKFMAKNRMRGNAASNDLLGLRTRPSRSTMHSESRPSTPAQAPPPPPPSPSSSPRLVAKLTGRASDWCNSKKGKNSKKLRDPDTSEKKTGRRRRGRSDDRRTPKAEKQSLSTKLDSFLKGLRKGKDPELAV